MGRKNKVRNDVRITYWVDKGGVISNEVEVEINLSKIEDDKKYFQENNRILKMINSCGGVALYHEVDNIFCVFNKITYKYFIDSF